MSALGTSMGVLLVGKPGTGKTVQAKHIASEAVVRGLPVIYINSPESGEVISEVMDKLRGPVVFLIDEFEKVYEDPKVLATLLTLMDGTGSSHCRVMWVMTSNTPDISPFLSGRPGRIRYRRQYETLEMGVILAIINDRMPSADPALKEAVISAVRRLRGLTVDGVVSLIDEVLIHGETPDNFMQFLNVRACLPKYNLSFEAHTVHVTVPNHGGDITAYAQELGFNTSYDLGYVHEPDPEVDKKYQHLFRDGIIAVKKIKCQQYGVILNPSLGKLDMSLCLFGLDGDKRFYVEDRVEGQMSDCIVAHDDGTLTIHTTGEREIKATPCALSRDWGAF